MSHGASTWAVRAAGPAPAQLTVRVALGRSTGQARDRHAGLDFASPAGAIIRAPAAGRVVLVAPLYFTGNTVVLDHGYGVHSILAHMQRTLVREGQAVERARVSAGRGDGPRQRPHLHWSVRVGSTRVDPAALLDLLAAPAAHAAP